VRGTGPVVFGVPSALRGTFGVGNDGHWAAEVPAASRPAVSIVVVSQIFIVFASPAP
jgi:hypothetical protein